MVKYYITVDNSGQPYISHHGIKGQKWGVRRFRNEDGTLTVAGEKRYKRDSKKAVRLKEKSEKLHKKVEKAQRKVDRFHPGFIVRLAVGKEGRDKLATWRMTREYKLSALKTKEVKLNNKINKWQNMMESRYGDVRIDDI